jgi:hypothetical protein
MMGAGQLPSVKTGGKRLTKREALTAFGETGFIEIGTHKKIEVLPVPEHGRHMASASGDGAEVRVLQGDSGKHLLDRATIGAEEGGPLRVRAAIDRHGAY